MPLPKYTRCSSCLRHINFKQEPDCPFCGETMVPAAKSIGAGVFKTLRNSRASILALSLAGGLSFSVSCDDEKKPTNQPDSGYVDPGNDYGGFDPGDVGSFDPPDMGNTDAGSDTGKDVADDTSSDANTADANGSD